MKRPLLNYFGGKFSLRFWILENFPKHKIYVEPFGGAASILLSKEPARHEIYNDLDGEIVNVFKVTRDKGSELKEALCITPYSRSEYEEVRQYTRDPLEQARRTIVKSFFGISHSIHKKSGFRNSTSSNASPAKTFRNYVDQFDTFIERLRPVVLENLDWRTCIEKYDSKDTLFYIDPPYVLSKRVTKDGYGLELEDCGHIELVDTLKRIKGKAILSGYENDIYSSLNWRKEEIETSSERTKRKEVLWMNYEV